MKRPIAFVVEDQMNLSMLYEDALRLVGYDVLLIRNGIEAVNAVELNEPPAFIILDVNLPGLSGRDVLQHIRKNANYVDVPVLVATANSVMAKVIQPELGENDQLFIKPVSMIDLQKMAKDIAKKKLEMSTQEFKTAFEINHDTESMNAIKEVIGDDDDVNPDDETLPNRPTESNQDASPAPSDASTEENEAPQN